MLKICILIKILYYFYNSSLTEYFKRIRVCYSYKLMVVYVARNPLISYHLSDKSTPAHDEYYENTTQGLTHPVSDH